VSKRHQSNRRKTYGRRQHELSERRQRDAAPGTFEAGMDDLSSASLADTLAFLDPRAARMIFALGD
jgi:hypothetical protein